MNQFLAKIYWGNSVYAYLGALGIFIAIFIAIRVFRYVILKELNRWAQKTTTTFDDFVIEVVKKVGVPLLYLGAAYLSSQTLVISPVLRKIIHIFALAVLTYSAARILVMLLVYMVKLYLASGEQSQAMEHSLTGTVKVIKVVVWGVAIIFLLDNLGFKVSTVVAGLGIGGIAIGLAAQSVLKDVFSYFSILFDRPFEIGDFIILGEYLGTVEYIGIKTTRVRSLGGEQLIFSNTTLTDSCIRNYKRMQQRRVVFKLGVTYQTTHEQLTKLPGIIEKVIKDLTDTRFDRAHFASFADSCLEFEVVYYVLSSDYNKYMDIQQQINFNIKHEFERIGVEFAYPTQTIFMAK